MTRRRTQRNDLLAEGVDAASAALAAAGITTSVVRQERDLARGFPEVDAVLELTIDDRSFLMALEVKAYGTGATASSLVDRFGQSDEPRMLVADKITAEARTILTDAGWSWLDRRGWLHLRAPGVRVDLEVAPAERAISSSAPAISGRSGITIAFWLCQHPGRSLSPNRHASTLRLAPSTISTTVRRFADAGLVDETGAGISPELFWELAAVWRADRTWLARAPHPKGLVPADPLAPSWRLTGTAAAAAYGAPVASVSKGPLDLYVTGPVEISIATRRFGAAAFGAGEATVAVPPTFLVNERSQGDTVLMVEHWPAAPLLAVALDLAQDQSRGREILSDWKEGRGIWR